MTSTVWEQTRVGHEKLERLESLIVSDLLTRPKTQRGKIDQDHRTNQRVEEMARTSELLAKIYEDEDGPRKEELNSFAPGGTDRTLESFYDHLKDLRNYYRKYPNLQLEQAVPESFKNMTIQLKFSGEECDGKFLDLHELHDMYLNLKGFERVDYLKYLDIFFTFQNIPYDKRAHVEYRDYLKALFNYLTDFITRAQPLENLSTMLSRTEERVKKNINDDPEFVFSKNSSTTNTDAMDTSVTNPNAGNTELYCATCQQSFTKDTVFASHNNSKKHKSRVDALKKGKKDLMEEIVILENKIVTLAESLSAQISNTKRNVEKRQSMTWTELEANREIEGQEYEDIVGEVEEEEEEEGEEKIWNPKGLPLDVTGKPIPYWLWKLHGLGVEYTCEICGNYSYWGHYAFEKHFQEARHQNSMKILKIPNTKAFHHVTSMEAAAALFSKIKQDSTKSEWKPDLEEEYEDDTGNVIPGRTLYADMVRQGLVTHNMPGMMAPNMIPYGLPNTLPGMF